jgi:hypothetical protein
LVNAKRFVAKKKRNYQLAFCIRCLPGKKISTNILVIMYIYEKKIENVLILSSPEKKKLPPFWICP